MHAVESITIHVPAIPIAQPRPRATLVGGNARVYSAPSSHPVNQFKASCQHAARQAYDGPPLDDALRVSMEFILPRPRAMLWKTKPMPRELHTKKPDCDNLSKAVKDALNGIVWRDDSQICDLSIHKRIASGEEQPHVTITVEGASWTTPQAES